MNGIVRSDGSRDGCYKKRSLVASQGSCRNTGDVRFQDNVPLSPRSAMHVRGLASQPNITGDSVVPMLPMKGMVNADSNRSIRHPAYGSPCTRQLTRVKPIHSRHPSIIFQKNSPNSCIYLFFILSYFCLYLRLLMLTHKIPVLLNSNYFPYANRDSHSAETSIYACHDCTRRRRSLLSRFLSLLSGGKWPPIPSPQCPHVKPFTPPKPSPSCPQA